MKNFLKSNLPSINKLYSFFYSNLFENEFSIKRFYWFTTFTLTLLIFGIFFIFNHTKVLASDGSSTLPKIVDEDGKTYDVWFETKDFGLKFTPKTPDANGECTYNYADLFTPDSPRSFKSLPSNVDLQVAKNIVWEGLAVFIPECGGTNGFWHTTKDGLGSHGPLTYNFVTVTKNTDGTFKITLIATGTTGGTVKTNFCYGTSCDGYRIKENTFKWIRGLNHGIFHTKKNSEDNDFFNCHHALKDADTSLTDTKAKEICQKFICRNDDLKKAVQLMKTVLSPGELDPSTDVDPGACAALGLDDLERPLPDDSRTDGCAFYDVSDPRFESDCRFDIKESTPGDTCKDKNEFKTKVGYKYFCNRINKVVKCEVTGVTGTFDPSNYSDVFESNMETLKSGFPTEKCYIPAEIGPSTCAANCILAPVGSRDPNRCCFGAGPNSCKNTNTIINSLNDTTKNLYCSSDNKVVNCGKSQAGNPLAYHDYATICNPLDDCRAFKDAGLSSTNITHKCSLIVSPPVAPPAVANACKINVNSSDCEYGDSATINNCWDKNTYKPITLDAGGKYRLFCQKINTNPNEGKVIICPESLTDYSQVFVGLTKFVVNPTFSSQCKEYYPGISEKEARLQSCNLGDKNKIYLDKVLGDAAPAEDITSSVTDKQTTFRNCIKNGNPTEKCFKDTFGSTVKSNAHFFKCDCSTSYNPNYDYLWCTIGGGAVGFNCEEKCILRPTNFANYQEPKLQEAFNPIQFIKVVSDFLFSLAVIIFIINMLRASFMYITSSGDEGKMKEAYTTITNTIFGMVFIVFIGAVITYFISLATKIVGN